MGSQKKTELKKKRKSVDERRVLIKKKEQSFEYFFVKTYNMALCLICKKIMKVFKDCHLKRHYMQNHAAKFDGYQGVLHKGKTAEMKKSLLPQHNLLEKKVKTQIDSVIKAPYIGGRSDCKNKTFTGSEFIKQRIESVADIICS